MVLNSTRLDEQPGIYMLVGGAGVPNFGDELIVRKWLSWLRARPFMSRRKIVVELNHARVGRSMGFDLLRDVFPSSDLSLARYRLGGTTFVEAFDAGRSALAEDSVVRMPPRLLDRMNRCDVFHLHGGGYLNDYWPSHAFSLGLGCALKENFGTRVLSTGLGVGPLGSAESIDRVKLAVDIFDYFELRDDLSKLDLGENVTFGLDDVFLDSVETVPETGRILHLSMIGSGSYEKYSSVISKELIDSFDACYFWVCSPQDAAAYAYYGDRFRHIVPLTPVDLMGRIPVGIENFMFTDRFHPHLIGARLGFGGVYVSNNDYYDVKHGSILKLGSSFVKFSDDLDMIAASSSIVPSPAVDLDIHRVASKQSAAFDGTGGGKRLMIN